jgi:hypothetical protein
MNRGDFGPDVIKLTGHFHIYYGESLTNVDVEPVCLRFDAETMDALEAANPVAWLALITCLEQPEE